MLKCFFDIQIGEEEIFRLVFELFDTIVPKTATNFAELCKKSKGDGFLGSKFHRIIPEFMAQGGDFTNHNGTGGKSIYGNKFPDENFQVKHTTAGLLSMANSGPNTNGSQFFITFAATPWLDGKHVVFGKVVEGIENLKKLEKVGTQSGKVKTSVTITECGVIE